MAGLTGLKGKTVLVTGASGFIGRHLVNRIEDAGGVDLVVVARGPRRSAGTGTTLVPVSLERVSLETWRKAGIDRIDVVLHLGAFTPKTRETADDVEAVYRDNLWGTRSLLNSLPSTPEAIVFSSTLDVYAQTEGGVATSESSSLGPTTLYGSSKLFCEQLVTTYARRRGCGSAILRYGHIFGPGEEAYGKLIPHAIRQLLRGEAPTLDGDGSAERDLLYVGDVVEATLRAAGCGNRELGPVNIVRGASQSIRAVIEILARLTGFRGNIPLRSDRPVGRSYRFTNTRMREMLGDWPLVSLEDGLEREVEYMKKIV